MTAPTVTRTDTSITITIPVRPFGKRPGEFIARLGFHVPDRETDDYMVLIRDVVRSHLPPEPWRGPLEGTIWAFFSPPASWSKAKRAAALRDELRPDVEPDADNISKAVWDALQPTRARPARAGKPARPPRHPEGAMANDGQITDLVVRKRYAAQDSIVITLTRLDLGRGLPPSQPRLF
jgi:Holliday junction resolvase RusA-like endonuclease